jgi:sulfoxide reductase heme-binding subunit YedZ
MNQRAVRLLKIPVFLACLVPLGKLALEAFGIAGQGLGANPIEQLIHRCGLWGLIFLLVTLSVTPVRMLTGQNWLIRFRRMFGLFAFFYICLHFLVYSGLDQRFDLTAIGEDIVKRPYITLGITGLVLLIPLALTSTASMMRRLGPRWLQLHRLVYLIAMLGVWHFYWQVKKDISEPLLYAGILALLLAYRAVSAWRRKKRNASRRQEHMQGLPVTRQPSLGKRAA